MTALRAQIVATAISWELTPYHPHARLKGVGVDCAQLPIAVYSECGCMPEIDIGYYSQQWMMHRDEELYLEYIRRYARDIPVEDVLPGDLVIWKFGRTYSHSAIIIDAPLVIHAVIKGGAVLRADMSQDTDLNSRPCLGFSVFNEDGSFVWKGE